MGLSAKWGWPSLLTVAVVAGLSAPAQAAFVQYGNRATFDALGPHVAVDWSVFGPDGTVISTPDSRTVGGITVGVASSQGVLKRYDEGTSFTGNFAVGDHLLGDDGSESDSFIVSFGSPVRGLGTQVDSHYIRGAYSGRIDFFSATNVLLFSAPFAGNNTFAQDNTAPFVGVTSNLANISYAAFLIDQSFDPNLPSFAGSLLINRLDVLKVPEPSSLALMCTALMGIFGFGFLRRKPSA